MNTSIRIATIALTAFSLSGCQSFTSALGFGPKDGGARAEASQSVFGSEELERGRQALKAGYPANAIQQFRLAALDDKSAPDAFNGLGVAYAKLGRADLAERYFQMAVSLDGTNPKYVANLQRFYDSPLGNSARALAMREKETEAKLASLAASAEQQGLLDDAGEVAPRSAAVSAKPAALLTRTSKREIILRTAPASGPIGSLATVITRMSSTDSKTAAKVAEADQAGTSEQAQDAERKTSSKQITMSKGASDKNYPVRISLISPASQKKQRPARAAYPLRVALNSSQIEE